MRLIFMVIIFLSSSFEEGLSNILEPLGTSGIDGTDLLPVATRPPITDPNAVVAMRNALLAQPKDTAWVVATGTLTNVALLFATFPEVADHVRGVSIMGGAIGGGFTDVEMSKNEGEGDRVGNTTQWAEFNVYVNPPSKIHSQSIYFLSIFRALQTIYSSSPLLIKDHDIIDCSATLKRRIPSCRRLSLDLKRPSSPWM